jgi:signal transduction histidine kinase
VADAALASRSYRGSMDSGPRRGTAWSTPAIWGSALAIGAFQLVGSFGAAANQPDRRGMDAVAVALLVLSALALALRGRWPLLAVALTVGVVDVWVALGYAYGPIFLGAVVALVTAILDGRRRATWLLAGIGYAGFVVAALVDPYHEGSSLGLLFAVAAWLVVVLALAELARVRRDQIVERRRAAALDAERRRDEQRLALAQDLHDVLAHTLSMINVQAGVALHLVDEHPEQAKPALTAIKAGSAEALGELRTALDVLRHGETAPRTPAPRLAELPALLDSVRAGGLALTYDGPEVPPDLAPATEQAAYRIVQEALTNVTRHAHARHATVRVRYDDGVRIEVVDDGVGSDAPAGIGITGMRQRAESCGGTFVAGPWRPHGFRVAVHLPRTLA